jgi:lipid-A-disaccharide synthase
MTSNPKYYIIVGERSGDLHGSNLVKAMLRLQPNASFRGFGGDEMQRAGVDLVMHYDQLAFMGFVAVINFFKIARYMSNCKKDVLANRPDALILIDYGGFNRRMATFGKSNGIKVIYYIPPKVWAWRQGRAWQLKRDVDKMFVILPFEKEFFKKYDFEVDYVGNPVVDAIKAFVPNPSFLQENKLDMQGKIVALLPGSRKMELERIVPLMAEVAKLYPKIQFVVAAVRNLDELLYQPLTQLPNVKFIHDATYDLLAHASAAIVTSGTATLETALFKVPQVVVYKAGELEYAIATKVVKVKYISLVNLIAGKEVVKELIQKNASAKAVSEEIQLLLQDGIYRTKMIGEYKNIYQTLDIGSASENTAKLILEFTLLGGHAIRINK